MNDEIKTDVILRAALESNKHCFIPRYVGAAMDMLRLHSWEDYESLPETSWKIKQPPADDKDREVATDTGLIYSFLMLIFTDYARSFS